MTECRGCKSRRVVLFLPLGEHPPANGFLSEERLDEPEETFPLDAHVCLDCGLIQVEDQIPPDFFRHYVYVPSASPRMQRHFSELARELDGRHEGRKGRVIDVGCNDGSFLRAIRDLGWATLGIDPATNIVEEVRRDGIDVVNDYLTVQVAEEVRKTSGPADLVVTTNTIHHIGDLDEFMSAVDLLLADDGVFVVEVPHAERLVQQNEFDGIYHEHVSQMTIRSFVELYRRFGLRVDDVQSLDVHGGSVRVFAVRGPVEETAPEVLRWVEDEERAGLFERATYERFRERVEDLRERLVTLLSELSGSGKRIAGYGASARGNTVLNYCGIGPDLVAFVSDRNELKQGLFTPGMRIPVRSPDALVDEGPDYVLLLAWNFAEEIFEQQREYLASGGRFVVPLPEVRIMDSEAVLA